MAWIQKGEFKKTDDKTYLASENDQKLVSGSFNLSKLNKYYPYLKNVLWYIELVLV